MNRVMRYYINSQITARSGWDLRLFSVLPSLSSLSSSSSVDKITVYDNTWVATTVETPGRDVVT